MNKTTLWVFLAGAFIGILLNVSFSKEMMIILVISSGIAGGIASIGLAWFFGIVNIHPWKA